MKGAVAVLTANNAAEKQTRLQNSQAVTPRTFAKLTGRTQTRRCR